MADKNTETGLFCNRTSFLYYLSHFLHNQRLSKTASPRILGGRMNQRDLSNTNNILIPLSIPVNHEED